jgi:hypothetical protein
MSAANIAGWFPIHGLTQQGLREMGFIRNRLGIGHPDPNFSPEAYIHRMFERRPMLTRLHQRLREAGVPGTIHVRFEKNGDLLIIVYQHMIRTYYFDIPNMYDVKIPENTDYDILMSRLDFGTYLRIKPLVYEIVRQVADEERAAALGEIYEAAADRTGHPASGNVRHGPVGTIMRFGGYKRSKKSRKNRKAGSSKARK